MESVTGFRVGFTAQFLEQRELKLYRRYIDVIERTLFVQYG